jgi:hypothetical protein
MAANPSRQFAALAAVALRRAGVHRCDAVRRQVTRAHRSISTEAKGPSAREGVTVPQIFKTYLPFLLSLLKGTQFEPLASTLEASLADGRVTLDEGFDIEVKVAELAEKFFPADIAECELAKDLGTIFKKYFDAKAVLHGVAVAPAPALSGPAPTGPPSGGRAPAPPKSN